MTPSTMFAVALLLLPALAGGFEGPEGPPPTSSPRGFSGKSADTERKWEQRYRSLPQASVIRESNRILSAEPHHVGSPYDEKNARWILSKFLEFGLDASIETFYPLFSTPKERVLEMIEPAFFRAALAETPVEGDPTSSQTAAQLPTYNVYSIDGDVTASLVYVNYGVPADYEKLARLGVDVRGKVVIVRYGASWRGIKPKVAAEHGAVGCLIYSDPRDDGYFEGDVYPAGPYRPPQGVQRGSVSDGPLYAGDPLTPGVGATNPNARFDLRDAKTLTKIPVLPISYGDARPLLAALAGPVAPREWRGALPITYHVGPGPAKAHLKVSFDWKITPVRDVIARIPGSQYPDEWVIRGNHHDAWVNGSSDPVSGLSALLEEAAAEVADPEKKIPILRRLRLRRIEEARNAEDRRDARERGNLRIGALGSGSDYTTFVDHLGIASINLGFGGEGGGGVYHSIYDDFAWYTRFSDTDFSYGRALAQVAGTIVMRLSDADLLPFAFTGLSDAVARYVKEIHDLAKDRREAAEEQNRRIDEGVPEAVADPSEPYVAPKKERPVPAFELSPLEKASASLTDTAREYDAALSAAGRIDGARLARVNALLRSAERMLTREEGLPRRSWFKHYVYAPGFYTGYDVKTLPAVREAIEEKQYSDVNSEVAKTAEVLQRAAANIRESAKALGN